MSSRSPAFPAPPAAPAGTPRRYRGFPQEELLFVYNAQAFRVAPADRLLVLHLAEALHPRAIADHLSYVPGLEAAADAQPAAGSSQAGKRKERVGARVKGAPPVKRVGGKRVS